ncbi:hypothetical protein FA15DRAFT_701484 [Coprinopsis marcescibilis]|uniref:Uncharacterized protein n=1 Tax=Coprinopsis marcescibilis TaxID=230819 RepID=A0A5C3LH79_COPMA|nr:hypothetical protein FA15DRAFT_701484 [Coprinopsis marcescibilis]
MANSDNDVLLIYDNSSPRFSFINVDPLALERSLRPSLGLDSPPFSYNQTFLLTRNSTAPGEGGGRTRGFSFEFEGMSFALFGQFSPTMRDRALHGQFFVSPPLSEGRHNLMFEVAEEWKIYLMLDYAVVTGGQKGQYNKAALVVMDDGTSEEVFYWGQWTPRTFGLETLNIPIYLPHQNNTRRTTTIGTGFRFRFSGTSIQVYGVKDMDRPGAYNLTWILDDGGLQGVTYRVSAQEASDNTSKFAAPEYHPHWPMMSFSSLEPMVHTLTVNLTYIEGETQGFIFDYMAYQPTFSFGWEAVVQVVGVGSVQ